MLDITNMAEEVQELTAWQATPMPLAPEDYVKMVVRALRRFFVDINRPTEFDTSLYSMDEDGHTLYLRDFWIDEYEYILCLCKIEFFKRVQTDFNDRFGYSTDALTVTNADKPYLNLKDTIEDLQHERRILFNKMIRYTLSES